MRSCFFYAKIFRIMTTDYSSDSERLAFILKATSISLSQLAISAGLSPRTLSYIKNGRKPHRRGL